MPDADPDALQRALDALGPALEPLDGVMADGFLCALQLRPQPLPEASWLRWVLDIDGRPARDHSAATAASLLRARADTLRRAIAQRRWFDPWVFELADADDPAEAVVPWAAGFALAAERFALPLPRDSHAADEPLALIYRVLDPDDWPGVAALSEVIDELEPPASLDEAVEDLVRAVLLLADLTGPAVAPRRNAATAHSRAKPRSGRP